jgi:hypothetical protein
MGKSRRADDENVKADLRPRKRNRSMLHEEVEPVTKRQVSLAEHTTRKKRKAPKVVPVSKRTRDAAMRQAQRSAAKGY